LPASSFGRDAERGRGCSSAARGRDRLRLAGSGFGATFGIGLRAFAGAALLLLPFAKVLDVVFGFAADLVFVFARARRDGRAFFRALFREPLLDRVAIVVWKDKGERVRET